jgi:mono/diheme cytochrome c family protein
MRYALLLIFLALAFGGAFASRRMSGEPVTVGNVSARSAAELYAKNCASYHGRDGRAKTFKGKSKHARNLADSEWQGRVGDERIFNSIMNGKGKMPGVWKESLGTGDRLPGYLRSRFAEMTIGGQAFLPVSFYTTGIPACCRF